MRPRRRVVDGDHQHRSSRSRSQSAHRLQTTVRGPVETDIVADYREAPTAQLAGPQRGILSRADDEHPLTRRRRHYAGEAVNVLPGTGPQNLFLLLFSPSDLIGGEVDGEERTPLAIRARHEPRQRRARVRPHVVLQSPTSSRLVHMYEAHVGVGALLRGMREVLRRHLLTAAQDRPLRRALVRLWRQHAIRDEEHAVVLVRRAQGYLHAPDDCPLARW
mmetsp:Transcript_59189/g.165296  ORF Transcript_59189/g.165296 Transcript_59189/m.165296 type:complete len:219 (+) Transcript_59189:784-1440(+)